MRDCSPYAANKRPVIGRYSEGSGNSSPRFSSVDMAENDALGDEGELRRVVEVESDDMDDLFEKPVDWLEPFQLGHRLTTYTRSK